MVSEKEVSAAHPCRKKEKLSALEITRQLIIAINSYAAEAERKSARLRAELDRLLAEITDLGGDVPELLSVADPPTRTVPPAQQLLNNCFGLMGVGVAADGAGRDATSTEEAAAPTVGKFTDERDGQAYRTVKIGNQVWMAENLNYAAEGSVCYNNDPANGEKYGRLYDWETAKKACPAGWHLPTDAEWTELTNYVGGGSSVGTRLKSKSGAICGPRLATDWDGGDMPSGTDDYGFSALPGGNGYCDGDFRNVGDVGYWWSATEYYANYAWTRGMDIDYENVNRLIIDKTNLFSVRCVQDSAEVSE